MDLSLLALTLRIALVATLINLPIALAVSWLVVVVMRTGRRIRRGEAFVLLAVYGVVLGWLAVTGATT